MSASARRIHDSLTLAARLKKFVFQEFPQDVQELALQVEGARRAGRQIPALQEWSNSEGDGTTRAYQVAAAACALRQGKERKNKPIGRKIGFTNKAIWPEFNIDRSNWGYMYTNTVRSAISTETLKLDSVATQLQPRIEPEIVFRIGRRMTSEMSDVQMLDCIQSIAHGFEIVQSIFPDWQFASAADTTATGALHRSLVINKGIAVRGRDKSKLIEELQNFKIRLFRNGKLADSGAGKNVLGSPLQALRHLNQLLEAQTLHPGLGAGEVITTGTLTKALPISDGDVWTTELTGIGLEGLKMGIEFTDSKPDWVKTEGRATYVVNRGLDGQGLIRKTSGRY